MGRDILFIERNLDFLKPGGRMAIVLPQGRFNNSSDKYIRDYLAERCRILAVIGLHGNTFKPHTGTKTSVLLVQKWDDILCPKVEDYNIFFATMRKSGKDNSGEKIYSKNSNSEFILDSHNHLIVEHDLFNHDGLTEDGIAEAFIEFAKKEGLSFFYCRGERPFAPTFNGFDAVKYQLLMDRLEATEIKLSQVIKDSNSFRFDSNYFQKQNLTLTNNLSKFNLSSINIFAKVTDGDHSKFPENEEQEIRYLRAKDIKGYFLENDDPIYVSKLYFRKNKRSHIEGENILISIMGSVGDITITPLNFEPCLCNRALAIVKDIQNIDPYFLFAYLITDIANMSIDRLKNGGVQERINLDVLGEIKIPIMSFLFQKIIRNLVIKAYKIKDESKQLYQEAEELLLTELGLKDWQPTEDNITVKSFSSSFVNSGRLDAEYYQPKYDQLELKLSQFKQVKIGDIINYSVSSGSTPKAGGDDYTDSINGIPFIRAVDLKDSRVETDNFIYIKPNIHQKLLKKTQLKKNDVLFSIAGTVGRCAIFDHDFQANINQAIAILRFDETIINRLYLITFFNCEIGKLYLSKYSRQGLQTNLNLEEVTNLKIPIIDLNLQIIISDKIEESFRLIVRSKQLLEIAKKGVEKAIESEEETAIKWINEELEKMGIEV